MVDQGKLNWRYQPAQKWLKDRKGRTLANSALTETYRLTQEIDTVLS